MSNVQHCVDHLQENDVDPANVYELGWCYECHRECWIRIIATPPAEGSDQ